MTKDYSAAVEMYKSGLSLAGVAGLCGVSRQWIWQALKIRGIERRPQRRGGRDNHFFRNGSSSRSRKQKAHRVVAKALKLGLIPVKPCEVCGEEGVATDGRSLVHAHHDDYEKPLEVRWLCRKCHYAWHRLHTAQGRV